MFLSNLEIENLKLIRCGMTYFQICDAQRTNSTDRIKIVYELCVCAAFYLSRIHGSARLLPPSLIRLHKMELFAPQ